jgi:sortase (surface protein transpeptidase)
MKLPKLRKKSIILIIACVVTGIVVYLGTGVFLSPKFRNVSNKTSDSSTNKPLSSKIPPTAINIPKIGKNLVIKSATVSGNNWDMFPDAVAWLSTSAAPGSGNVILYAHDWTNLWADLYLLTPGDPIEIMQGTISRTYLVSESRAVDEHDIQSILSDKNRLTLYTCEGSFDQKRRVVYADPVP